MVCKYLEEGRKESRMYLVTRPSGFISMIGFTDGKCRAVVFQDWFLNWQDLKQYSYSLGRKKCEQQISGLETQMRNLDENYYIINKLISITRKCLGRCCRVSSFHLSSSAFSPSYLHFLSKEIEGVLPPLPPQLKYAQ